MSFKIKYKRIAGLKGKYPLLLIVISLILFNLSSCRKYYEENLILNESGTESIFPYNLKRPDAVYSLPGKLDEISGITYHRKNKILCIQDEEAIIYSFDTENGKINSQYNFGKKGDYEDLAIADDIVFVLRSDGTIYQIKNFEGKAKVNKIETSLDKHNNAEGLFYDEKTNSLLLACKGAPLISDHKGYKEYKAIYSFDLKKLKLGKKPLYMIDTDKIDLLNSRGRIENIFIDAAIKLRLIENNSSFQPSGIASHPIHNGHIFIISSTGKMLIILNSNGLIIDTHELDSQIFNQPEGICFNENGDLFISNEGKRGTANILKFNYSANKKIK